MSWSRVAATWWRGRCIVISAWNMPQYPAGRQLRWKKDKKLLLLKSSVQVLTNFILLCGDEIPLVSWSRTKPHLYWWPAYPRCSQFLLPTRTRLESLLFFLTKPLSLVGCWAGGTRPVRPSHFACHKLGLLGGCRSHVWAWGPCFPGLWPRRVAFCDKTILCRPSCSQVHAQSRTQHCSRCSEGSGLKVWFPIAGIWYPFIPLHWAPSHSPIKIHSPILCSWRRRRSSVGKTPPTDAYMDSPSLCAFLIQISERPLTRSFVWSPVWNSTRLCMAAMLCP